MRSDVERDLGECSTGIRRQFYAGGERSLLRHPLRSQAPVSTPGATTDTVVEPPADFGRHSMFVFGHGTVLLSHLPMFMAPHDAQLLLEATLEDATGRSLLEAWEDERASHADERLYTVMPEKFALSTLYSPDPPARASFRARFFRGHLERGGRVIPELADVVVRVTDVLYARRFDRSGKPDDLTYLLVGHRTELFLVHRISEPPDFDQILAVELNGSPVDEEALRIGVEVVLEGRPNTAQERLRDGATATARGHVTGAHQFLTLEITGIRELYFEEGELMTSRGAFEPTPLEIEAGFGN